MTIYKISLSNDEKIGFMTSFSTMLSAGIPILEIVDSLLQDVKGNQKKILEILKSDLIQGNRLYASFAKFPQVFDKASVSILKAAEEAGTLETSLNEIKQNMIKEIEFVDKIKAALAYPVLIIVVFSAILMMMLLFVIPKIAEVFSRLRVTMPLPTRIMIFVSNMLLTNTVPIIIIALVIIIVLVYFYITQKKLLMNFLFSLPLISGLARQIDMTRFCRTLAMLLTAGIPITFALELAEEIVVKKDIAKVIKHLKEVVLSGKKLSDGMKDAKTAFPALMIKITEAGEKSGTLEKTMQDIADYLDYQVSKTLKTLTTLLEPVMMIVVGIMIGGLMLSIIAPIYGMMGQFGAR